MEQKIQHTGPVQGAGIGEANRDASDRAGGAPDSPYCFRVGSVGVKIEFAADGPSLQELLTAFFIRRKKGL
ncbi:MAG: hypothetical protein HFI38_09460 [Lachnospiraceae bacterium]|nr:hypothetical protein [Lachnospiraceae bacterium]